MNKIIRDVRVDQLPKEWQDGLPLNGVVEIELRTAPEPSERTKMTDLIGLGPNVHGRMEDILAHIEDLRSDR